MRSQSLVDHSRDVAAVFDALIALPGVGCRLAQSAGLDALDPVLRARLTYIVHLHDCGKVNAGFQARRNRHAPVVGHVAPLAAIIGARADRVLNAQALAALRADRLVAWGSGVTPLWDAILSHHGRPWPRDDDRRHDVRHWRVTPDGYNPMAALATLREDADAFVPEAHASDAPLLPDSDGFIHAVAGLAQLADWIASSDWERAPADEHRARWAAERLCAIGIDPRRWRDTLGNGDGPTFTTLFGNAPYPHQAEVGRSAGHLLVLESETGSGKTEAALWRFATLFAAGAVDGLYFALPTRTAAVQIHKRVTEFAARLWPSEAPPVVLAVPGYLDARATTTRALVEPATALPAAPDPHDGPERDVRAEPVWAAEHPKRYFAGLLAVGTIDQALLAALRVKHAHLRGASLMRHLLVVDEVHASDAYMRRLLGHLLRDHLAAGGYAILLSATLGAEARHQLVTEAVGGRLADRPAPNLETAAQVPYPLLSAAAPPTTFGAIPAGGREKEIAVEVRPWLDDADAIAEAALLAARVGAKVLVVRNTVDGAVAVQRALEARAGDSAPELFRVREVPTLHHGRFAGEDRRLLDAAVERALGRTRPRGGCVVIGTQTLEQSLDIDADLLLTDLCPVDVLLQRLGRLHRHTTDAEGLPRVRPDAYGRPQALVLVPDDGLAPFLRPSRPGGLRRHGLGHRVVDGVPQGVYRDLTILEATRRLIAASPCWRIPAMNRVLVEHALHSQAIDAMIEAYPADEREAWRAHRSAVEGDALSQAQIARDGALLRDRPFMDPSNTRFDDHLVTRLGANDRLVELPAGTVGPFGESIGRLAVPGWLARGVPDDASVGVRRDDSMHGARLHITLGDLPLTYDRHGLRRAEDDT